MAAPDRKVDPGDLIPRYYQVYLSLVERIQSGEFPPGALIPTERQLGEEYGVSRITIIKAHELLERDGYVNRQQGRGTFAIQRSGRPADADQRPLSQIAFIATSLTHPYLSSILVGIAGVSAQHGRLLQVLGSVNNSQQEIACVNEAMAAGVQGLITYACGEYRNADLYREVLARGIAVVFVDRYYPEIPADHVVFDDFQAGYDLTTALIRKGHRRIAFALWNEERATSVRDRLAGYRQAIEAHGLSYDEDLVWVDLGNWFVPSGERRPHALSTDEWLLHHLQADHPTALITINYDVAERVIYALHAIHTSQAVRAPGEFNLEVTCFSHKIPPHNTPFITDLAMQPGDELGVAAATLLFARLSGTLPREPQHVKLPMAILDFRPDRGLINAAPSGEAVQPASLPAADADNLL